MEGSFNMNRNEIYENYLKTLSQRANLEQKIADFVERWRHGSIIISDTVVQQTIDKGNERLEELKKNRGKIPYRIYCPSAKRRR